MDYFVYLLCDKPYGTFYIGVTNNLARRMHEHKGGLVKGFSNRYKTKMLVYHETYSDVNEAIHREKQLKHWHRDWKIDLVHKDNRMWRDLCEDLNM